MRYFLPLYLLAYVAAAFFWRSYWVRRKTGINPIVFKDSDDAHDFIGRVFKLLFALVLLVVVLYSFFPAIYQFTIPIHWLERTWLKLLGVGLMVLSLMWTVIAQNQMGESWRIGVDRDHRSALVQRGVFNVSRNPIFVGMMTTLAGLFLVMPNALTLLTTVLGVVLIAIQVRLEEEFLLKSHGEAYIEYKQRVRRWF